MAFEDYVRDLSYLESGDLSDLTLHFEEQTWHIHKALTVCHSKWFRKALTSGFEETDSSVITLKDESQYAHAIDCMVTYFYKASYSASKYNTSEALLHSQVAILADKYDCASLYKLSKSLFAESIKKVESDEWRDIAAFIYDFTTTEAPAHVEIRSIVVTTVTTRYDKLKSILKNDSVVELLRSNADLATDLLLGRRHGSKANEVSEYLFTCDHCRYSHSGPQDCSNVSSVDAIGIRLCPQCGEGTGGTAYHHKSRVDLYLAYSCGLCDGFHTIQGKN